MRAQSFQKDVRLRKVFTAGSLLFIQERNGRQPETIDTHLHPEIDNLDHLQLHFCIIKIQFRLVPERTDASNMLLRQHPRSSSWTSSDVKMTRASLYFSGESLQT